MKFKMLFLILLSVYAPQPVTAGPNGFAQAPSQSEAIQAIVTDYFLARGERPTLLSSAQSRPAYPTGVDLDRCEWQTDRRFIRRDGTPVVINGHECIMKIYTMGWPAVQTQGFFHHDSIEWVYFGEIREPLLIPIDRFDKQVIRGELTGKPGSTTYNGTVSAGREYAPYDEILGRNDYLDIQN